MAFEPRHGPARGLDPALLGDDHPLPEVLGGIETHAEVPSDAVSTVIEPRVPWYL